MHTAVAFGALKRAARRHVRADHWSCMSWCRSRFGVTRACASYFALRRHPDVLVVPGKSVNVRRDIAIRPGSADQEVFNEVFVAREYDLDGIEPKIVVDAGAHIGLASVMFASRYPQATVIAIEPEDGNFALLASNARGYDNIEPVHAGLWEYPTSLRIDNPGAATWAFQVVEDTHRPSVRALSIAELMKELQLVHIDILKMDIEGSEIEVLRSSASWLGHVDVMMIELHDRFRPGCRQALDQALAGYAYEIDRKGHTTIVRGLRRKAGVDVTVT